MVRGMFISTTELLSQLQASQLLNVPARTLEAWRFQRRGPVYVRVGKAIRYKRSDIEAFLEANTVRPAGEHER